MPLSVPSFGSDKDPGKSLTFARVAPVFHLLHSALAHRKTTLLSPSPLNSLFSAPGAINLEITHGWFVIPAIHSQYQPSSLFLDKYVE
jgi:hypothetical protein